MTFKEILRKGYKIHLSDHSEQDYDEKPELSDIDSYRVDIITLNGDYYKFDFEYEAPFEEAVEYAFDYVSSINN